MMVRKSSASSMYQVASSAVALALALTLLALAPFAAALEVHHALAAADFDGHQHSDSDLCQWVQHHTSNSLLGQMPAVERLVGLLEYLPHGPVIVLSVERLPVGPPRAPPMS